MSKYEFDKLSYGILFTCGVLGLVIISMIFNAMGRWHRGYTYWASSFDGKIVEMAPQAKGSQAIKISGGWWYDSRVHNDGWLSVPLFSDRRKNGKLPIQLSVGDIISKSSERKVLYVNDAIAVDDDSFDSRYVDFYINIFVGISALTFLILLAILKFRKESSKRCVATDEIEN